MLSIFSNESKKSAFYLMKKKLTEKFNADFLIQRNYRGIESELMVSYVFTFYSLFYL